VLDPLDALPFRQVWAVDFEFIAGPGERPDPVCMVAWELRSGRKLRLWRDQFGPRPPFPIDDEVLFVAYFASAELGCFRALGWPMPRRILDLYVEYRNSTNILRSKGFKPIETSLIDALVAHGLDSIGTEEKEEMRALVLRGGPWSAAEQDAILSYCESDVAALARLLPAMLPKIDLGRGLLRGRYMAAVALMEHFGIPLDLPTLNRLLRYWDEMQERLIQRIDAEYGVFEGRTFKYEKFEAWLIRVGIPWPRHESGKLDLSDDAFHRMASMYPIVAPLRELRNALSELRLHDLAVGRDGRNRCLLSPFRARTSRNQPSNSKNVFGPSTWIRSLIKPPEGYGIAYIDFEQQEFGIGAALPGDPMMMAAYRTGDPYLAFAKQAGAVPPDATKQTHEQTRELFKTCALGVLFGMEVDGLARRLNQPPAVSRDLLRAHHETYRVFWRWSDRVVDHAILTGALYTVFGWTIHVGPGANPRALRNYLMQGNGAEMLRLACCLATEQGIEVCAPIHDALLISAPLDRLDSDVAATQLAMAEASRIVLGGFELRTEAKVVRYPDRYVDKRGARMWAEVMRLLDEIETSTVSVA
jgi:hypothetical protein